MTPFNLEIPEEYLSKLAEASVKNQKGYTALLEAKEREIERMNVKIYELERHMEQTVASTQSAAEEQQRQINEFETHLKQSLSTLQNQQNRIDDFETFLKQSLSTIQIQQSRIDDLEDCLQRALSTVETQQGLIHAQGNRLERLENQWTSHMHYHLSPDGQEVLDTRTGLMWRRAVEPGEFTYEKALEHAAQVAKKTGLPWRVPTKKELKTLIDKTLGCPAIDTVVFPSTPSTWFWSSSPYAGSAGDAWVINFDSGDVYDSYRSSAYAVRLVRGH